MLQTEFDTFFQPYSQNVDRAAEVGFWKLSDAIVLSIIQREVGGKISAKSTILDAGGGTGRWISSLSEIYPADFVLYDLSKDMLEKAHVNLKMKGIESRVRVLHGDLTNMEQVPTGSVDYVISTYAPIGFVPDHQKAFKELYRVLVPGGKVMIMGHGYHNSLYSKINNYNAPAAEIAYMAGNYRVKWAEAVPELNTYSQESMTELLREAGFEVERCYAVGAFIQPEAEDFDPSNKSRSRISRALENPDFFEQILELEMAHNSNPTVVNRGVNIMGVGRKEHA